MTFRPIGKILCVGLALVLAGLSAGCRVLTWGTVAVVGTVGMVGYGVYKGGEGVANGVGSVVGGGDDKTETKQGETVVLSKGELKAECPGSIASVWQAARVSVQLAKLQNITGTFDLFSGEVKAQTWEGTPVTLKLKNVDEYRTAISIRFGPKGDVNASESLYKMIREELSRQAIPATTSKNVTP